MSIREFRCGPCGQPFTMTFSDLIVPELNVCDECLREVWDMADEALVQTGPYGLSRNPQLVGFGLGLIGFPVLWASWHMLVSMILFAVLAHLMVVTEEKHLRRVHGELHTQYYEQNPRYVGAQRLKLDP